MPLVGFLVLSLVVTWPLVRNFSTAILGIDETRHNLWVLWHAKQALLGREPVFSTHLLYYPLGITLLIHSSGPLLGWLTLPAWLISPAAVYNAALLISFSLSGYFMYLLARAFKMSRGISWFVGGVFLAAPIHTVFLYVGHLGQVFLGMLPLTLLAFHYALDLERSRWWTIAPGIVLGFTLLDAGWNFISAILGAAAFVIILLLTEPRERRRLIFQRVVLVAVSVFVSTAPLLFMTIAASRNPAIPTSRNVSSFAYQPDLMQFLLPVPVTSRITGPLVARLVSSYDSYHWHFEMAVFIPWMCWGLSLLALLTGNRSSKRWVPFSLFFLLLALGPTLLVSGKRLFTVYDLPIVLPYAFLSSLPVFDVIRTPGRFVQMGYVGIAMLAGWGTTWLGSLMSGARRNVMLAVISTLTLLEIWPCSFPQEHLREVPDFYRQIADDKEMYGVFDLPIRPYLKREFHSSYIQYSAYYQMYQMTHGKGIATGYISRQYEVHPLFGHIISDAVTTFPLQHNVFVNGIPANRYANVLYELVKYNYRYVVFHKPQAEYPDYKPGSWGELMAKDFVQEVFGTQPPLSDDGLATVYEVPSQVALDQIIPTIALRDAEEWVTSPATFYVAVPEKDMATLTFRASSIQMSASGEVLEKGWLTLESADGARVESEIRVGEALTLPLSLLPGSQIVTVTITSEQLQLPDADPLNFAVGFVNLHTRFDTGQSLVPVYTEGWYGPETWDDSGLRWRWASSPAQLLIYSSEEQTATLHSIGAAVYDPVCEGGVGMTGTLQIALNDELVQSIIVHVGQPLEATLILREGVNHIRLYLDAGNFRPADLQPGNGDMRWLSFALREFEVLAK